MKIKQKIDNKILYRNFWIQFQNKNRGRKVN